MGEAQRRSLHRAEILRSAERCVYCDSTSPSTIEHMPPRSMFKDRDRPSGWEFPCCSRCNSATRGADAVAQLVAKIDPIETDTWKLESIRKLASAIEKYAPGVSEELFRQEKKRDVLLRHNGLLRQAVSVRADGPLTKNALDIFSLKISMAAFQHFTARPLEMGGFVHTQWYTNAGMDQERFDAITSIMPESTQLIQGKKTSGKQFSLRYNTNEKDIVAALFSFHGSFFVSSIVSDGLELAPMIKKMLLEGGSVGKTERLTEGGLGSLLDAIGAHHCA